MKIIILRILALLLVLLIISTVSIYYYTLSNWRFIYESGITLKGIKKNGDVLFSQIEVLGSEAEVELIFSAEKKWLIKDIRLNEIKGVFASHTEDKLSNGQIAISGIEDGVIFYFSFDEDEKIKVLSLRYDLDPDGKRSTSMLPYISYRGGLPRTFPMNRDTVIEYFGKPEETIKLSGLSDM